MSFSIVSESNLFNSLIVILAVPYEAPEYISHKRFVVDCNDPLSRREAMSPWRYYSIAF